MHRDDRDVLTLLVKTRRRTDDPNVLLLCDVLEARLGTKLDAMLADRALSSAENILAKQRRQNNERQKRWYYRHKTNPNVKDEMKTAGAV